MVPIEGMEKDEINFLLEEEETLIQHCLEMNDRIPHLLVIFLTGTGQWCGGRGRCEKGRKRERERLDEPEECDRGETGPEVCESAEWTHSGTK